MKTQGISGNFTEANVEALAVAVFKNEKPTSGVLKDLDRITGGILAATSWGHWCRCWSATRHRGRGWW